MRITIHKGATEIGGTCIEVSTDTTSVLLDLGQPLAEKSRPVEPARLTFDAVLLSHSHQDHYGLVEGLPPSVPVYTGRLGREFIDTVRIFLGKKPLENDFHYFTPWTPFYIGDIQVKPYLMDHSAADAYGFLLEADGKRVFYSGDFRGHGRKNILFDQMIQRPPEKIDALLMEGTMMRRGNSQFPSEESVQQAIFETIRSQKNIGFLVASSQNLDRVVSAWKACRDAGKTLVVDLYTAWVLELAGQKAKSLPSIGWQGLQVLALKSHNEILKSNPERFGTFTKRAYACRIPIEGLRENPENFLVLARPSLVKLIETFVGGPPVNIIYSQWLGYLDSDRLRTASEKRFAALKEDKQVNFVYAHTSGHATVEDLKCFAKALRPQMLIPVHTEYPSDFRNHFADVRVLSDGEPVEI